MRDWEPDVILLNPAIPGGDANGASLNTFRMIRVQAPETPVILILDDHPHADQTGRRALREGAQDYLLRSRCDWQGIAHAIENAIERSRLVKALWGSFLFDPQTGLPNRTGFLYMAETLQSAMLHISNKPVRMMVGRMENESSEGDLIAAADSIRSCVNDGDLTGRLGVREFAVLSLDLDLPELITRMAQCQPVGIAPPRIHWTYCENPPGLAQPMESLLHSAERVTAGRAVVN
jgi:PleD family two-component response regulator